MRIAVLLVATNRYCQFVPSAVGAIQQFLLSSHDRDIYVWTDAQSFTGCIMIPWAHEPWPGVTLRRYHAFSGIAERLSEYDYVFYMDVDMRPIAPVGDEILGNLVATQHPYQSPLPREQRIYERRPESRAYMGPLDGNDYFYGGFQGGSGKCFMAAVNTMKKMIDADLANGIVPLWHDESIWNRYCMDHPPDVVLSPSYAYPEGRSFPFHPKIVALNKDHDVIRAEGWAKVVLASRRALRSAKGRIKRVLRPL